MFGFEPAKFCLVGGTFVGVPFCSRIASSSARSRAFSDLRDASSSFGNAAATVSSSRAQSESAAARRTAALLLWKAMLDSLLSVLEQGSRTLLAARARTPRDRSFARTFTAIFSHRYFTVMRSSGILTERGKLFLRRLTIEDGWMEGDGKEQQQRQRRGSQAAPAASA